MPVHDYAYEGDLRYPAGAGSPPAGSSSAGPVTEGDDALVHLVDDEEQAGRHEQESC